VCRKRRHADYCENCESCLDCGVCDDDNDDDDGYRNAALLYQNLDSELSRF